MLCQVNGGSSGMKEVLQAAAPALNKAVCLRVDGSGSGEVDVEDGTEGGPQGRDKLDGAVGGDGVRNAEP